MKFDFGLLQISEEEMQTAEGLAYLKLACSGRFMGFESGLNGAASRYIDELPERCCRVIFDLSDVIFYSDNAPLLIKYADRRARKLGGRFLVCCSSGKGTMIRDVLEIMEAEFYENVEEAVSQFGL